MFTILHSEWPKLNGVLTVLSTIGLMYLQVKLEWIHFQEKQSFSFLPPFPSGVNS